MAIFSAALSSLDPGKSALIQTRLDAWKASVFGQYRQVAFNIETETALSVAAFASLLDTFVDELLRIPGEPETCWIVACSRHQFQGPSLPAPIPQCLGRAMPIGGYAKIISEGSKDEDSEDAQLTPNQCENLLRAVSMAGASPPARFVQALLDAPIGRCVIWATFCALNPADSPFDHIPRTTADVRTALGLGECAETETLVLISYRSTGATGTLELYRPSVAEAADYHWYRPCSDPAATFGMSFPLSPNRSGIPAQPEVVHRETTGATLFFPVYLAV